MPRLLRIRLGIAWLFVVAASPAARGEPIERDWLHTGNGSVTVDNAFGSVTVVGWSEPRVELRGDVGAQRQLEIRNSSDTRLHLAVVDRSAGRRDMGPTSRDYADREARLVLRVPHAVALTVTSVTSDVRVSGMRRAPMVAISTVSGDHEIDVNAGAVQLKTVSGDIRLRGASARSTLSVISGDVQLRGFAGGATVSTVSGDLRIVDATLGFLDIESISGDVRIAAVPAPRAAWAIEAVGGDIDVAIPSLDRVAIEGSSFSGDIEHPGVGARRAARGVGKRLDFRPTGSDARISFETFSGDVTIRTLP